MKKVSRRLVLAMIAFVLSLAAVPHVAMAETGSAATEQQLTQIRNRCSEVQASLSRVHSNDALLRVNRGQIYERISTKLMVPFNSRIALNRLDGSTLLTVTSSYEQHLSEFRLRYQAYEEQLSATMKTDCKKQAAKFYDGLKLAREKRQLVYESVQNLGKDISEYKKAFTDFAQVYRGDE
jgi:hypothetical protein